MKILLVFDCNTDTINGAAQSVANLYQGLEALGQDVRILCPEGDGREQGFFTKGHDFSFAYPGLKMSVMISGQLLKKIVAWRPDVVHSNSEGALCWWSDVICRKTGARHVHTFHTNFLDFYGDYFPFVKSFLKVAMPMWMKRRSKKLDAVVYPSEWGREVFKRLNLKAPEYVIPNGIHTEIFGTADFDSRKKIRSLYGVADSDVLLIFTGRVAAEKNIPELLRLFSELDGRLKLMIVGGGPALESVRAAAAAPAEAPTVTHTASVSGKASAASVSAKASTASVSGKASTESVSGTASAASVSAAASTESVSGTASTESVSGTAAVRPAVDTTAESATPGGVIFTGMVPPEEMPGFYAAGDIFVTASLSEIQPLTYVEAMASRLPVVCACAHYVDGLITNGETGYAFSSEDEFVSYIGLLAGDYSLRCRIGESARARVIEDYSVETFAKRCMEVYEKTKNH